MVTRLETDEDGRADVPGLVPAVPSFDRDIPEELSLPADSIEEQRISSQRLAAVLRTKAEKNNSSLANGDFDECCLAPNSTLS